MKLYILEVQFYDYENFDIDTEPVVNVYSDFKSTYSKQSFINFEKLLVTFNILC